VVRNRVGLKRVSSREVVSAQPVDATPSNRLMQRDFSRRTSYSRSKLKQGSVFLELKDFNSCILYTLASV